MGQQRAESFERYYLRQVAMGEGCNCGELVLGKRGPAPSQAGPGLLRRLGGLLRGKRR